jgi:exodeoxyribonuclease VII small subunit
LAQPKFEAAMKRLEDIVEKMEEGELTLDESLKLFEEGIKLSRDLNNRLEQAERRVEELVRDEAGGLKTVPFAEEPDDAAAQEGSDG